MNGKTTRDILRAFQEILPAGGARTHLDAGGPSKLILDQERGWRTPAFLAFLAERGIGAHFKEDKFAANALAPVDNLIKRIKQYLRRRLTEEQLDAHNWTDFFDESIRAQNQRKHEVLSRMSPNELVGADGAPQSENAAATIFSLEQEQAEKLKKNKERHERRKTTLQREGAFRVPVELAFKKRALQASHGGELHPVANFEGSRVVSALDGRAYPMGTVAPASRHSLSVQLPPRLQRPGKMGKPEQRQILEEFTEIGRRFLRPRPEQSASLDEFDAEMRRAPGFEAALQRAGFRNAPGDNTRATGKFADLFGDFKLARKTVFLEKADTSDEEDMPSRPTIEERDAFLARAVEEVRGFPEFREGTFLQRETRRQRLRRAEAEVRAFPEFAEDRPPATAQERRFARAAQGNRRLSDWRE